MVKCILGKRYSLSEKHIKNNKEFILLSYYRKRGGDIRRFNYKCCECKKDIGQMEAVARHFAENHPEKFDFLKNLLGIREFLYYKARVCINKFLSGGIDFNIEQEDNKEKILIDLILSKEVKSYVKEHIEGAYNVKDHMVLSNVEKETLRNFLTNFNKYILNLLSLIDNYDYIIPSETEYVEQLKALSLDKHIYYSYTSPKFKKAYFIIDNIKTKLNEQILKNEKASDEILQSTKDKFNFFNKLNDEIKNNEQSKKKSQKN